MSGHDHRARSPPASSPPRASARAARRRWRAAAGAACACSALRAPGARRRAAARARPRLRCAARPRPTSASDDRLDLDQAGVVAARPALAAAERQRGVAQAPIGRAMLRESSQAASRRGRATAGCRRRRRAPSRAARCSATAAGTPSATVQPVDRAARQAVWTSIAFDRRRCGRPPSSRLPVAQQVDAASGTGGVPR